MRLLDREILRCEGKIPQFAPSAQLRGKLLYNVSLRASESSECFGDSEGARLGNDFSCWPIFFLFWICFWLVEQSH